MNFKLFFFFLSTAIKLNKRNFNSSTVLLPAPRYSPIYLSHVLKEKKGEEQRNLSRHIYFDLFCILFEIKANFFTMRRNQPFRLVPTRVLLRNPLCYPEKKRGFLFSNRKETLFQSLFRLPVIISRFRGCNNGEKNKIFLSERGIEGSKRAGKTQRKQAIFFLYIIQKKIAKI